MIQRPNGDPFEELPKDLEDAFREFWTDNANRLSLLYSGTGALKVDFTRTGKRTYAGELEDGRRAVTRYFINNFYDTYNQNALDLVLGKIKHQQLDGIARQNPTVTLGIALAVDWIELDVGGAILLLELFALDGRQDLQLELLLHSHGIELLHDLLVCLHLCQEALV